MAHFFSLGCILAISFISAVILSSTNITLAFYSLHTRAWELMAGAIVGLYLFHNKQSIDGFMNSFGSILYEFVVNNFYYWVIYFVL